MCPVIRISDELFVRLESHAVGFDTPAAVIERLLDKYEHVESRSDNENANVEDEPMIVEPKLRVNSKPFLSKNFPELLRHKRSASRMYESKEREIYGDCWWFNFAYNDLNSNEFIVFIGALDYENKNFRVFKVPTAYLLHNLDKIDRGKNGWINLYIHLTDLIDLRNSNHLPFREFAIN